MTPLRQRFIEDLQVRNYAASTIESYTYHVACFAKFFMGGRSPEVLAYKHDAQASVSVDSIHSLARRACIGYRITLPRDWPVTMIPFGKKPKTLPVVLGGEDVARLLACVPSPNHRMILTTLYASGLRLQEGLHLQVADLDSARRTLRVARGKGARTFANVDLRFSIG